ALAIQADAAFVGGERVFQTHLALLHLLDQLFERVQRLLEIGDRRGFGGGFLGHGRSLSPWSPLLWARGAIVDVAQAAIALSWEGPIAAQAVPTGFRAGGPDGLVGSGNGNDFRRSDASRDGAFAGRPDRDSRRAY